MTVQNRNKWTKRALSIGVGVGLSSLIAFAAFAKEAAPAKTKAAKQAAPAKVAPTVAKKPPAPRYPMRMMTKAQQMQMRDKILKIARRVRRLRDYTMIMFKRERVGGTLKPREKVFLKFRHPFSAYMRWIKPAKGRQVLFVLGKNNNKLKVRDPSSFFARLAGTINLSPTGSLAMRGNRHSIYKLGMNNLMKLVSKQIKRYEKRGDMKELVHEGYQTYGKEKIGCLRMRGPKSKSAGYYAYKTRLCWDENRMIPTRVTSWDWKGRLVEDYSYSNIRLNVGLTDMDFSPKNPKYGF